MLIKVDVIKGTKTTKLYFEARVRDPEIDLEDLDAVYQTIMGSDLKEGGYLDSNKFMIEIKNET